MSKNDFAAGKLQREVCKRRAQFASLFPPSMRSIGGGGPRPTFAKATAGESAYLVHRSFSEGGSGGGGRAAAKSAHIPDDRIGASLPPPSRAFGARQLPQLRWGRKDSDGIPGVSDLSPFRLSAIELDEKTVVRRTREIEQEREIAIYDLLDGNEFRPSGSAGGPYKLILGISEGRLVFDVRLESDEAHGKVM